MNRLPVITGERGGYILLITILIVGAIATAIVTTLLFLGASSTTVSIAVQQSSQAIGNAQACADYALLQLRTNPQFEGNLSLNFDNGTCDILSIGGMGNSNRFVCT